MIFSKRVGVPARWPWRPVVARCAAMMRVSCRPGHRSPAGKGEPSVSLLKKLAKVLSVQLEKLVRDACRP
jgi:hypothetical protein